METKFGLAQSFPPRIDGSLQLVRGLGTAYRITQNTFELSGPTRRHTIITLPSADPCHFPTSRPFSTLQYHYHAPFHEKKQTDDNGKRSNERTVSIKSPRKAVELLKSSKSIRKTAAITGLSKSLVGILKLEHKKIGHAALLSGLEKEKIGLGRRTTLITHTHSKLKTWLPLRKSYHAKRIDNSGLKYMMAYVTVAQSFNRALVATMLCAHSLQDTGIFVSERQKTKTG